MFEAINAAAEKLHNRHAGWVTRRDSAELLGKIALRALGALHAARDETDVDVHRAVETAMGQAAAALEGVKPRPVERSFTLDELVRSCEKAGERTIEKISDEEYTVGVTLKNERHQSVHVRKFKRSDNVELVQVYTVCGPGDEESYAWALRANTKLVQSAMALEKHDDGEHFILTTSFLADHVTRQELKSAVKETAYYGDWIEGKLTGQDEF